MKRRTPILVTLLAIVVGVFCIFGDNSYGKLQALRESLRLQQDNNQELGGVVQNLRREVRSLQTDERAIEKAARNELGMARPNEMIFFFDKEKDPPKNDH